MRTLERAFEKLCERDFLAYQWLLIFVETSLFTKLLPSYLDDGEYRCLQAYLLEHPESGDLIKGSGGIRKAGKPMNRSIGQEILDGIAEIKQWQAGEKKLNTSELHLPRAADVAGIRKKMNLSQSQLVQEYLPFMRDKSRPWIGTREVAEAPVKARQRAL